MDGSGEVAAMMPKRFAQLALEFPAASAGERSGHPDFRVAGKIFATLGYPDEAWGMVKLTSEQQAALVGLHPEAFAPVAGAWGRQGNTNVRLAKARVGPVRDAREMAWHNAAPKGRGREA